MYWIRNKNNKQLIKNSSFEYLENAINEFLKLYRDKKNLRGKIGVFNHMQELVYDEKGRK